MSVIDHSIGVFLRIVHEYGYAGLAVVLALGVVGLPLPDETILVLVGILVFNRKMDYVLSIVSAAFGSAIGITVSYIVGNFVEQSVIAKLGRPFRITESRFQTVQSYMSRFGKWVIFLGYFVPGVRHLTALIAGLTDMPFRKFAGPAYIGAVVWTALFITIGKGLGHGFLRYKNFIASVTWTVAYGAIGLAVLVAVVVFVRKRRQRR